MQHWCIRWGIHEDRLKIFRHYYHWGETDILSRFSSLILGARDLKPYNWFMVTGHIWSVITPGHNFLSHNCDQEMRGGEKKLGRREGRRREEQRGGGIRGSGIR